jgi:GH15 family glucan-1,4-alpha-glucosidase
VARERYTPIGDHAAIGDGRTVALVALEGSIDWLCLPDLDSPSVFASLLDAGLGGSFTLAPEVAFEATHHYLPFTNVLVTVFTTPMGAVQVIDALTLPDTGLSPFRELVRRIQGLSGRVPMRWAVQPAFEYGRGDVTIGTRNGVPIASSGDVALAVNTWNAGESVLGAASIGGRFTAGTDALIAMSVSHQEPLVLPTREEVEARLEGTISFWRGWAESCIYAGRWRDAVVRSVLALKLLVFSPSGALAAAATTSLPEGIGGERNWDYRFCWVRDAAFTLSAFLQLGFSEEAKAFFWWLMQASQLTHPHLEVLYGLDGGVRTSERELSFEGYRDSRPVRVGNVAGKQSQLDIYGDLLQTAWVYASSGHQIDPEITGRLSEVADLVCDIWREPDSGIWEVRSEPLHFTQSKMMLWVALDRAIRLAESGVIDAPTERWMIERDAIDAFVESRCWSEKRSSYVRSAGSDELDAAVLLGALFGYRDGADPRMSSTIDAIGRGLGEGQFIKRYSGEDGVGGPEGAFLACSFWFVETLARSGQRSRAVGLMDELVSSANEVGLFSEEIDPENGDLLGNFPQALTHLSLISAALAIEDEDQS